MIGWALALLAGFVALSLPVAAALGLMGYVLQAKFAFFPMTGALGELAWNSSNDFILIAAPMFIMMGELMHRSGMSERLFSALSPLPPALNHRQLWSQTIILERPQNLEFERLEIKTIAS